MHRLMVFQHVAAEPLGTLDAQPDIDRYRGLIVLGARAPVFQWHGYTYDLPSGAVQLARTDTCEQQAFRWGSSAYGFQFHLEADAAMIERWLSLPEYQQELAAARLGHDEQAIRPATTAKFAGM